MYVLKTNENIYPHRNMHMDAQNSIIHNSPKVEKAKGPPSE